MAEKEYIERGTLIKEIKEKQHRLQDCDEPMWEVNKPYFKGMAWAHRLALDAPAADVVEVRHGEWQQYDQKYCSVCGAAAPFTSLAFKQICSPYCHMCGAKMDGENREKV